MNVAGALAGACLALAVLVVLSSWRSGRSDPVNRSLPRRPVHSTPALVAALLRRWETWVGNDSLDADLWVTETSRDTFRSRQAVVMALLVCGAMVSVLAVAGPAPVPLLSAGGAAVLVSVTAYQRWNAHQARAVREAIGDQVGPASEMVALAVTAGRAPADALAITASMTPDPLRSALHQVSALVAEGERLDAALREVQARLRVPEFDRFANTLLTATARGVPLAATLLAHVADIRSARQAADLQKAGRREIAMLVPIVLLILPCVVMVSLLPGAIALLSLDL